LIHCDEIERVRVGQSCRAPSKEDANILVDVPGMETRWVERQYYARCDECDVLDEVGEPAGHRYPSARQARMAAVRDRGWMYEFKVDDLLCPKCALRLYPGVYQAIRRATNRPVTEEERKEAGLCG